MESQPAQPQAPETPSPLHCRVPSSATSPKLDQHPDSTNSTHHRYEETPSSYDPCRVERKHRLRRSGSPSKPVFWATAVSRTTLKSYLKQAPVRQMRHKTATKLFAAATNSVSLNTQIVSGKATSPRPYRDHNETPRLTPPPNPVLHDSSHTPTLFREGRGSCPQAADPWPGTNIIETNGGVKLSTSRRMDRMDREGGSRETGREGGPD